jgi:hypothetical protein
VISNVISDRKIERTGESGYEAGHESSAQTADQVVGAAGIEPATTGLENRCSIQLSYAPSSKIYHKPPVEYPAVSR